MPSLLQLIHAIWESLALWPDQNLDIIELISLHNVLESWNMLIVYVGMTWTTVFNKISLPVYDRNFSFYLCIRSQILPFIVVKELTLDLPMRAGNPRYLSYTVVELTLVVESMRSFASLFVFMLKKIEVSLGLIFGPMLFHSHQTLLGFSPIP